MSIALHGTCFDASALVKLYVDEPGSAELRQYWRMQATKYTTPFCFYEALGVLKRHKLRGTLTKQDYIIAAGQLVSWFRTSHSRNDIDFTSIDTFNEAKKLAEQTDLDFSDAFQLLSLHAGYFSTLCGESKTVLVTADERLAKAARERRLAVWDCQREPVPSS